MNRMLRTALSLTIIASSSSGCAEKPVKEQLKAPQVYGYTLNQPLSSDEFKALSAPGGENGMGSQVFNRIDEQGDLYEVLLDGRIRPEMIRKESRAFASQPECAAEFEAQIAQLKQLFASYSTPTRGLGPESQTLVPGDRYISVNTTECRIRQYDQTGTHRYAVSLSENTVTAQSKRGLGDKIDDAYEGAWITVLMIPLLPFVLIGWAVDKATD